jgi:DNA-binding response OmpR family regulator/predicted RNase H-like HicB family nuclease
VKAYRILVADDDADSRSSLASYLALCGYEVLTAANGADALTLAAAAPPDLVLLDVQMPVMDGFEALARLRQDPVFSDVPALLVTSLGRTNLKVRALDLGADDYVVKPFDRAELVARVRRALQRSARYRDLSRAMAGDLGDISLPELLQTLELGRKTARIALPDLAATIDLARGRLGAVRWRAFEGRDALMRLLLLERGSFRVEFSEPPDGPPEGETVQEALLAASAALDEVRQILATAGVPAGIALELAPGAAGSGSLSGLGISGPATAAELVARTDGDLRAAAFTVAAALMDGSLTLAASAGGEEGGRADG